MSVDKRFTEKYTVNIDTNCWEWDNIYNLDGYGRFSYNGESDIIEIRRLIMEGLSNAEIARRFNVSRSTISHIKTGRNWSWL